MKSVILAGLKLGIGISIGMMAVKEARGAYDRYVFKRKIEGLWSDIKKTWNGAPEETD